MAEKNHTIVAKSSNTTCACGDGCNCGCGSGRRLILWIVGIIVLLIVFVIGVKVGEFRVELRRMYGGYGQPYPMMQEGTYGAYGGGVPPNYGPGYVSSTMPSGTSTGL